MNANEINIAIAETQGWRRNPNKHTSPSLDWIGPSEQRAYGPPNYHRSLDAIVPVVRAMPDFKRMKAITALADMCFGHALCLATPAQWCEAYLKAEGLWK